MVKKSIIVNNVMFQKVKIVKILPHLIPLFLNDNDLNIYTNSYSSSTLRYLESIDEIKIKHISFTNILKYLQKLELNNQYKSQSKELQKTNFFKRVESINQKLEYSTKGDTISLWPLGYDHPIKFEFFGEICEGIYLYDEDYGRKILSLNSVMLSNFIPEDKFDQKSLRIQLPSLYNKKPDKQSNIIIERYIFTTSIFNINTIQNEEIINTDFQYPPLFYGRFDLLSKEVKNLTSNGFLVLIKTNNLDDLPDELVSYTNYKKLKLDDDNKEKIFISFYNNLKKISLPAGFISEKLKIIVLTDRELYGSIYLSRPDSIKKISNNIKKLLLQFEGSIIIGDYVVHEDYGVAIYSGLKQEKIEGVEMDYLFLKYAEGDELYVPIHQIEKITKYIGNGSLAPKLTRLGKATWDILKNKVKKSTLLLAKELVEHYAKRELSLANPIKLNDTKEYKNFVNEFNFIETEDQLKSINEILSDLEKKRPMNRLLIGDVGFGKTEVFMRAVFKTVENNGQVAILAPTTILTAQHYSVLKDRFKNSSFKIEYLSRFNSKKKNQEVVEKLNEGKINIVVGTHRLLSSDIKFKALQLIIVDEEQRFGVKQKEKIKKLNYGVHVLYVSATPIPRTLSMSLSSIQDMSIITQPPKNRKPIHTEIIKDDWNKISKAIENEIERNGQVYFLHNEIQTIKFIKDKLNKLTPGVKYNIAHGQMSALDLGNIMKDFYEKKFDCLISTTINDNSINVWHIKTIFNNSCRN